MAVNIKLFKTCNKRILYSTSNKSCENENKYEDINKKVYNCWQAVFIIYLLVHINMYHPATFRTFFLYILFNIHIKLWISLEKKRMWSVSFPFSFRLFSPLNRDKPKLTRKPRTSVAGSNILFSSRHSVGLPTGIVAATGRTGAVTAACPLIGKFITLWFVADPFRAGTPRDPTILKKLKQVNDMAKTNQEEREREVKEEDKI